MDPINELRIKAAINSINFVKENLDEARPSHDVLKGSLDHAIKMIKQIKD